MQKYVNRVRSRRELSKKYLLFSSKSRLRYSRERASQNLEVIQFILSIDSSAPLHRRQFSFVALGERRQAPKIPMKTKRAEYSGEKHLR